MFKLTRHCQKYASLTFGSTSFGWFGWFKTAETRVECSWIWQVLTTAGLENGRMMWWTMPCNLQSNEPSPILPEMSGNKPSPNFRLIIGFTMMYPGYPRMCLNHFDFLWKVLCVFFLTWACFRWLVIFPNFSNGEPTTWAIVEDSNAFDVLWCLFGCLFSPIQVDVPKFSEVKNPLTPAAAPQQPVTRRRLWRFGG